MLFTLSFLLQIRFIYCTNENAAKSRVTPNITQNIKIFSTEKEQKTIHRHPRN